MRSVCLLLLVVLTGGCGTLAKQGFSEKTVAEEFSAPDENGDQWVISETVSKVKLRDFVTAAPWNGEAGTDHAISYESDEAGWKITFGGTNQLKGGDIAGLVTALASLTQRLTELVERLNPTTALPSVLMEEIPVLEPL